jgi:hypothetical protein
VATATNYSREVGVLLVLSLVKEQLVEHKDFDETMKEVTANVTRDRLVGLDQAAFC